MVKQLVRHKLLFLAIVIAVCVATAAALIQPKPVDAYQLGSVGPERKAIITVSYTTYEWWLLRWSDSQLICQVYVEHEGWPEQDEVKYYCGDQVLRDWLKTGPCEFSDEITSTAQCPGFYLHLVNVTPGQREIEVNLLPPEVFVDIANCNPQPPDNRCETLPTLHLVAEEPLPNEQIINIQGYLGDEPFNCEGSDCTVPLPATGVDGVKATFWAESSFGDSSDTYTAQIRVIPWGDFAAPDVQTTDQPQWYVDIISSQYMGEIESTCSAIWSAFPPIGGPPQWLSSPDYPEGLISTRPYYYLAGSLITQGVTDASECPDGGLEGPGIANQCGLEASRPMINTWQNQFDSEIIQVSNDTGVPSQLMKNMFSRESQFWPGLSASYDEAGLGHLSDLGADTVLLWNPSFFSQFCPLVLNTTTCQRGFGNLDIAEQEMLRGALVQKVNAACPECPQGIDLRQANFSISVFARSLLANCEQVDQIIYNQTQRKSGEVSTYEDLWKFTLVNYNAGPGCLSNAVQGAVRNNEPITWENIQQFLEPGGCQASIDYVEDVSYMPESVIAAMTPTAEMAAPEPTSSLESSGQITPISTPTPTPTLPGYPQPTTTDSGAYP